jgi:Ca-activated chloride channel family protein
MGADLYSVLGVIWDASMDEIRDAYFELARHYHPDVNKDPSAHEDFIRIHQAYETLSDPIKRENYNLTLSPDQKFSPSIEINLQYSRSALPRLNEPQLLYVLCDFICRQQADYSTLPPVHLCLVLDRSTSMQGERMDMIKANTAQLLRQLRPQDYCSIVSFSDRAEIVVPPTRIADMGRGDNRISLLRPGGGTEMFFGLDLGIGQIQKLDNPKIIKHLILMTDGHTYGDEQACLDLARKAAGEGISISALGIGTEWNDNFLDTLTGYSGSNATFIRSQKDLTTFLKDKLTSLGVVYARGLALNFKSDIDVNLRYAFRLYPETTPLTTQGPIPFGDILFNDHLSVLLEFLVPPIQEGQNFINLAIGHIQMSLPARKNQVYRKIVKISRRIDDDSDLEAPPEIIVQAMSKLVLYRMQEKARKEVSAGNIDKATKHLHHLASHLLTQGDRDLAHDVLVEADHVQRIHQFSDEGNKRIKYGTRALIFSSEREGSNL